MKKLTLIVLVLSICGCHKSDAPIISNNEDTISIESEQITANLISVFFPTDSIGYAVGSTKHYGGGNDGIIIKTSDAGNTWKIQTKLLIEGATQYVLESVYFTDANNGYAVGGSMGGVVVSTIDGGITWTHLHYPVQALTSIFFPTPNTGYMVGYSYNAGLSPVFKTNNSGNYWENLSWTSIYRFKSVCFTTENNGYAVGENDISDKCALLKTTDGFATSTALDFNNSGSFHSVFFSDSNHGYVVGDSGVIYKTSNAGATWQQKNSGTTNILWRVFFTNPTVGYIVDWNWGSILKTTDGGETWSDLGRVDSLVRTNSIFFTDENIGYAVGSDGAIYKTFNGGLDWLKKN